MNKLEKIILTLAITSSVTLNSGCVTMRPDKPNNDSIKKIDYYEAYQTAPSNEWTPIIYGFGGVW